MSVRHLAAVRLAPAPTPPSPPSKQHAKYQHYTRQYREFKALGAKYEVKAMYTLIEFERTSICWKTSPEMTFEDVLREEKFCTISRFHAFRRALDIFRRQDIDRLGVDSVCLIAKQPPKWHARLTKAAMRFRKEHDFEPTYQYITHLVEGLLPESTAADRPTYGQLRQYVEVLKDRLKEAGAKVPSLKEAVG